MSVTATVTPVTGVEQNSPEPTIFDVPVVAFPTSYDYSYQWATGLILAGMMKRAKFIQYALPFITTMVALKEPYRRYKYMRNLRGKNAWDAWYTRFQAPALRRLGRPVPM